MWASYVQAAFLTTLSILGTAVLTAVVMRYYIRALRRRGILEVPNQRSSHQIPVPTGGGWIVLGVALVGWLLHQSQLDAAGTVLLAATLGLATISWIDDLHTLPPALRLGVQALAVAACLRQIPPETNILWDVLPLWLDRAAAGLGWLWFVNLYNFMDGVDGITAAETIAICLAFVLLAQFIVLPGDLVALSAAIAGAAAGFLVYNWHPARIILGDVGAIPLGFIMGWLLIHLAAQGYLAAAVILPLYYLADATITLSGRILRGEKFWLPHRQHFYQRPILAGLSHAAIVVRIALANAALIAAAVLSFQYPLAGFALAAAVVALLLFRLHLLAQQR